MDTNEERREYRRVPTRLNLLYEVLPPSKEQEYRRLVLNQAPARGDLEIETDRLWHTDDVSDKLQEQYDQLIRFMEQINAKVDYLIALEEGTEPPQVMRTTATVVSLSAIGLSFTENKAVGMGHLLKLRIQFSRFPLREILCLGRVTRETEQPDGLYDIGVQYECIHEDDRERIFRFISRVERKMLRERKEGTHA